eukprot:TRINITY_DN124_c0_g1_i1.p1 TRINITY_DN124_c0_g1~~TRINITY_DN124_c0_g1_i1.p1  ORF type:complete len:273 (-),score=33.03 TRINITY_DN124_c0_g1_i1:253-1011(-)
MAMLPGMMPMQPNAMQVGAMPVGVANVPRGQPVQNFASPAMTIAAAPMQQVQQVQPRMVQQPMVQQVLAPQPVVTAQPIVREVVPQPVVREVPVVKEVIREVERPPPEGRVVAERPIGREELYASGNLVEAPAVRAPPRREEPVLMERPIVRPAPVQMMQQVQTYAAPVQSYEYAQPVQTYAQPVQYAQPAQTFAQPVQTYAAPVRTGAALAAPMRPFANVGAAPLGASQAVTIGGGIRGMPGGMGGGLVIG